MATIYRSQLPTGFLGFVQNPVLSIIGLVFILTALKSHHAYTFTHIINVSILTLVQIEALGAGPRILRDFGLAAMFHDVMKARRKLLPSERPVLK